MSSKMEGVPAWNVGVTRLMRVWERQLREKSQIHSREASKLARKAKILAVFVFLFCLVRDTFQLSFFGTNSQIKGDASLFWGVGVAIGIFSLIITGVMQAKDFLDYAAKSMSHEQAQRECERLITRINSILAITNPAMKMSYFGSPITTLRDFEEAFRILNSQYETVGETIEFAQPSSSEPKKRLVPIEPSEITDSVGQESNDLGRIALAVSEPINANISHVEIGFSVFDNDYNYLQHQIQVFNKDADLFPSSSGIDTPPSTPKSNRGSRKSRKQREDQE